MTLTRVLLVEDEPFIQQELLNQIERCEQLTVYAVASDIAAAKSHLFEDYDLLVADKRLPDGSGIELIRQLNETVHTKKTMVMTVFDDEASVMDAISAGADGYFVKQDPHITDAMLAVMANGNPVSPSVVKYFLKRLRTRVDRSIELTPRESQTLTALAEGLKYDDIAVRLNVSKHTIPDYIKSLYTKLGVHDKSSAVYVGVQKGLITVGEVG